MFGRILIVDDDQSMCEMVADDMRHRGFEISWCLTAETALETIDMTEFDVILTDVRMPGIGGIELCNRVVINHPDVPVIVMTSFGSMDTAVTALRAGAYDFITKPVELDLLAFSLERAVKHRSLQDKVKKLNVLIEQSQRFDIFVGESELMLKVFDRINRVSDTDAAVLITGESGTGKELVAAALHQNSSRNKGPFVAVNCAALPESLLESELFGHTKGAFTDAKTDRKGLFLQADGGTLFLDEVGTLPITLQPKLLRALEEHKVRVLGSEQEVSFDVRIITASNHDLSVAIDNHQFREDLFFRINVIQIEMPPLRSRGTDILLLAQYFLELFAKRSDKKVLKLTKGVAEKLMAYNWPGNVRELRNAIEHASVLTRHEQIIVDDLPQNIQAYNSSQLIVAENNPAELISLEEIQKRYILHVVKTVSGNRTLAAKILGLDRKTLYRKLHQYHA